MRRDEAGNNRSGGSSTGRAGKSGRKIQVRNANQPGWTGNVDAAKYAAMHEALLRIVPRGAPGITQTEMRNKVVFHLPAHLFPNGEKSDWWSKCVQLDMEAKGELIREKAAKPLRWHRP